MCSQSDVFVSQPITSTAGDSSMLKTSASTPATSRTRGILNSSLVHPREVFRGAIAEAAAGIIVAHNHPSGDPTPSPDDLHLTAEALAAGRLLDIDVLDHLVVGHDAWVSLRDRGVSFDRPDRRSA